MYGFLIYKAVEIKNFPGSFSCSRGILKKSFKAQRNIVKHNCFEVCNRPKLHNPNSCKARNLFGITSTVCEIRWNQKTRIPWQLGERFKTYNWKKILSRNEIFKIEVYCTKRVFDLNLTVQRKQFSASFYFHQLAIVSISLITIEGKLADILRSQPNHKTTKLYGKANLFNFYYSAILFYSKLSIFQRAVAYKTQLKTHGKSNFFIVNF